MSDYILYYAPGTCARVPMTCLEEAGVPFESRVVSFAAGEQRDVDYLKLNPAGKVPVLIENGAALSENVAIIAYLDARFPDAGILPRAESTFHHHQHLSDLAFCASVLHPIVTRIRIPERFCSLDGARADVWRLAADMLIPHFDFIEARLGRSPWWYGEAWAAIDSYVNWVWFRVTGAGFPQDRYPNLATHAQQIAARPAMQRVLEREAAGEKDLAARGLNYGFLPVASVPLD
ncbi:MAG: glutathione S-transferase family protein [Pseudomonadota bacterium]|nr:glutathione S-transferase family protein [Pseudomonadota bacterium]